MVIPFGALSSAARRGLFTQYTQARWSPSITAQTIINEARGIGISVARTDMLSIIRQVGGMPISRSRIGSVRKGFVPGLDMYVQTDWKLSKRFQTIFDVEGRNVLTGESSVRQVSFMSDERMTVDDMKAELLDKAQREYALRDGVDYVKIVPAGGLERASPPFITQA